MSFFFFFNDTATTEIYTLSLHDALPISSPAFTPSMETPTTRRVGPSSTILITPRVSRMAPARGTTLMGIALHSQAIPARSEEHTSELQSRLHLVCRLLLEKKQNVHISPL